ncbi:MAG TPA: hypothetical protein VGH13_04000 [Xanthobacteraceae bacterium]
MTTPGSDADEKKLLWPGDDVILFDGVCNLVGKNRYRIFGKYAACIVPDAGWRARVVE